MKGVPRIAPGRAPGPGLPEDSAAHYAPSPGAPPGALPERARGAASREGRWDVVVVGAGHAGCEAAHACARMGLSTALLTVQLADTAKMSCNPAIGGVAKGQMVRELDALGGVMARVTDRAGIQFKMLNRGRGPAVWSPRAQCDKAAYSAEMLRLLGDTPGLEFVEGVARRVRIESGRAAGVELADGRVLAARAVVITPGTFLDGVLHIGERRLAGGRLGEHAARALSGCLAELGLERGRLKTGTPPRLHRRSIDFASLEVAPGDDPPEPFSHWTGRLELEQVECWTTHTNARTHEVIRRNMARSPLYSGAITGTGPRYCPSLEDKVMKFAGRERHHLFLEPEGRDVAEIYVNGVSTSMPEEVQLEFIRTIEGLERAEMLRPGYAVEYDFVLPHQLDATLRCRGVPGLWLAGQICGTSGYEEAAAQGFVAGVNAARAVRGEAPFVLRRDQAYIGVLVDDLVTREHREPYRMFTSAAEHRLLLRADNADERLAALGHGLGLLTDGQLERTRARWAAVDAEERRLAAASVTAPSDDGPRRVTALDWLARPGARYAELQELGVEAPLPGALHAALEVRVRYRGYIARQQRTAAAAAGLEELALPGSFWDRELAGLSREAVEKLRRWRPANVGAASRIAGVSPSDVAVLLVHARRARSEPAGMPGTMSAEGRRSG
jgi:tRNA uridine 5-carboxymethylaminomethyl modification enzyme